MVVATRSVRRVAWKNFVHAPCSVFHDLDEWKKNQTQALCFHCNDVSSLNSRKTESSRNRASSPVNTDAARFWKISRISVLRSSNGGGTVENRFKPATFWLKIEVVLQLGPKVVHTVPNSIMESNIFSALVIVWKSRMKNRTPFRLKRHHGPAFRHSSHPGT